MTTSVEQSVENTPQKPATGMQGLSVRQKIYIGFGGLMLLTILKLLQHKKSIQLPKFFYLLEEEVLHVNLVCLERIQKKLHIDYWSLS